MAARGRMVVAVAHHDRATTGAHGRFDRLVLGLAERGHEVVWIGPARGWDGIRELHEGLEDGPPMLALARLVRRHRGVLRALGAACDDGVVVTFGETNAPAAGLVARYTGWPLSLGVRSNIMRRASIARTVMPFPAKVQSKLRSVVEERLFGEAYRRVPQLVVQTSGARSELAAQYGLDPARIHVVENDLPPSYQDVPARGALPSAPRRILFVGNGSVIKGFDVLAAATHAWAGAGLELVVAGLDGWHESLAVPTEFVGRISDVHSAMLQADLLVVPSREDQFPNVVLEALALGLPVVGSAVDGIAHMLHHDALLFPSADAAALGRLVRGLLQPSTYAEAAALCAERARVFDFDWVGRYRAVLEAAR